jgi:endonuclease V-like protein UPF0215 family
MRTLHLEKQGLRGLAIAESFHQNSKKSILSGLVMRRDFVIDGFVFGTTTLDGDDATETILKMYDELNRPDISYVLISGLIISLYNIIDIKKIHNLLQIPVIGVTYNESEGIEDAITSSDIFVRKEGCDLSDVKHLLDELTLQGSFPEPLRVAQLLAKSLLQKGLSF